MARTIVAITGASSGIGAEFARRLAPKHDLILIARRVDRLKSAAEEYASRYRTQVETLQSDLCVDRRAGAGGGWIAGETKKLELMINLAPVSVFTGRFWESQPAGGSGAHEPFAHYRDGTPGACGAGERLVPRNIGALINVASVSGWLRRPGFIGYAATKSWMVGFTEGLHLELREAKSDVIVQALCPGLVYTEFHDTMGVDQKRLGGAAFMADRRSRCAQAIFWRGLQKGYLYVIPGLALSGPWWDCLPKLHHDWRDWRHSESSCEGEVTRNVACDTV